MPAVKVCGLTSAADASLASEAGADYLGFIFFPKSPRALTLEKFQEMRGALPAKPWVYVQVNPDPAELRRAVEEGFSFVQVHCPAATVEDALPGWLDAVGRERLWLAIKRPVEDPIPPVCLERVDTFLIDTYRQDVFGGSGETGDWGAFRQLATKYPDKNWVLAGGLSPDNLREAVRRSGARMVDVGSGVESEPGRKDPQRLQALFAALD